MKSPPRPILDAYLAEYAELAADPLTPEIQAYNTRRLNDLWKLCCERSRTMTAVPFWGIVWPGSRALARYIFDHPETVRNRRVLDVGCGSGVASVAAAHFGAQVTGMDIDADAIALARHTADVNGVAARCEWQRANVLELSNAELQSYDLILAGDLFYEAKFARRALAFIERATARGVAHILADPGRTHRPRNGEPKNQTHKKNGSAPPVWRVEILAEMRVPVLPDIEGIRERTTALLQIQ